MAISIPHFLKTVDEIEQNSWWAEVVGPKLNPVTFSYSWNDGVEVITEVPKEPFESLLLRVRRLTMINSAEHLSGVQKALKQSATLQNRQLLDVWRKYWRLAFIKSPFHFQHNGKSEAMTLYKVYDSFINGHYFHTDPEYNVIVYNDAAPQRVTHRFFQNIFHSVVVDLGMAAIALHRYFNNGHSFYDMGLNAGLATSFAFIFERNNVEGLDEQYKVFNDWIEQNGGCKDGRWS